MPYHLVAGVLCLLFLSPLFFLGLEAFVRAESFLAEKALPMVGALLSITLVVCLFAAVTALLLGGPAAWMVTRYEFAGRRFVSVLLSLPFAIPPYLLAAIYRSIDRQDGFPMPALNHPIVAGIVLGVALYPWVYLPLKAQLARQSSHYDDVAASLGLSIRQRFFRIHLALLLPTIGISILLVVMETLSDYGAAEVLGVRTLSVGIHDAMFSMYRRDWAAQLSVLAFFIPVCALVIYMVLQKKREVYQPSNRGQSAVRERVQGGRLLGVYLYLAIPLVFALLIPVGSLLRWSLRYIKVMPLQELPSQLGDTVMLALGVSVITLIVALSLCLMLRLVPGMRGWRGMAVLINLNYALPSVMLGIAVLFLSNGLPDAVVNVLLSESITLLVIAGCLAYLCFPFFSIQSGLQVISPRLDDLSATLGFGRMRRVFRVYLPLLRRSIACGLLLVLVNMVKELPLSQVLQPFGFQSLSMRLYTFTGLGMIEESALYALCLVVLVAYPVASLDRMITERTPHAET